MSKLRILLFLFKTLKKTNKLLARQFIIFPLPPHQSWPASMSERLMAAYQTESSRSSELHSSIAASDVTLALRHKEIEESIDHWVHGCRSGNFQLEKLTTHDMWRYSTSPSIWQTSLWATKCKTKSQSGVLMLQHCFYDKSERKEAQSSSAETYFKSINLGCFKYILKC